MKDRVHIEIQIKQISEDSFLLFQSADISKQLKQKYTNHFLYYMVTPINHIIFDEKQKINNNYKQITAQVESCEFMRRRYYYKGASGQDQIAHRIKLLSNYYSNQPTLGSFYPTMMITGTRNIFMKRFYRISKTPDPNDTSNNVSSSLNEDMKQLQFCQKSNKYLQYQPFFTQNCLSKIQSEQKNEGISVLSLSLNSQTSNIYSVETSLSNVYSQNNDDNIDDFGFFGLQEQQLEKSLSHLICDCQQFNVKQMLTNYAKYTKKIQLNNSTTHTKRQNINYSGIIDNKSKQHQHLLQPLSIVTSSAKKGITAIHIQEMKFSPLQMHEQKEQKQMLQKRSLQNKRNVNNRKTSRIPLIHKRSFTSQLQGNKYYTQSHRKQCFFNSPDQVYYSPFQEQKEYFLESSNEKPGGGKYTQRHMHEKKIQRDEFKDEFIFKKRKKQQQLINRANLLLRQSSKQKNKYTWIQRRGKS